MYIGLHTDSPFTKKVQTINILVTTQTNFSMMDGCYSMGHQFRHLLTHWQLSSKYLLYNLLVPFMILHHPAVEQQRLTEVGSLEDM